MSKLIDLMGDFGPSILPESIKQSPLDLYWLKEFSHRYVSKVALNKFHSGEIDGSRLTPKGYRELLIASGETNRKADIAAAKLHLEQTRNG